VAPGSTFLVEGNTTVSPIHGPKAVVTRLACASDVVGNTKCKLGIPRDFSLVRRAVSVKVVANSKPVTSLELNKFGTDYSIAPSPKRLIGWLKTWLLGCAHLYPANN